MYQPQVNLSDAAIPADGHSVESHDHPLLSTIDSECFAFLIYCPLLSIVYNAQKVKTLERLTEQSGESRRYQGLPMLPL